MTDDQKQHVSLKGIFNIENAIYQEALEESLSRVGERERTVYLIRYNEVVKVLSRLPKMMRAPMLLDVGCGCGYLLSYVGQTDAFRLSGIDFSKGRLHVARNRGVNDVVAADAQNLPQKDNTFDVVTSTETIEHLPNHSAMLRETKRVLRKGGILVLTVPSLHTKFPSVNPLSVLRAALSLYNPAFLPQDSGLLRPYSQKTCDAFDKKREETVVHKAFSKNQLKEILMNHGFSVIELRTIIFPSFVGRLHKSLVMAEQKIFQRIPILKDLGTTLFCVCKTDHGPNL